MPRYPIKPTKARVKIDDDNFGIFLISCIIGGVSMLVGVFALIMLGIPSSSDVVSPTMGLSFICGSFAAFTMLRFKHIPRKIKIHFAYKKNMKEYNRKVNEINLHCEREDSEAFIKLLKTGTVTRRSYEP